jgi:hypothetical protein
MVILITTIAISGVAVSAQAATTGSVNITSSEEISEMAMFVGGTDEAKAREAGNIVRTEGNEKVLIDGATGEEIIRIPADPSKAKADAIEKSQKSSIAGFFGVVTGNCGSSYLYLANTPGVRTYEFWTGFNLNGPKGGAAFDFDWYVNIRAEKGTRFYNFEWSDHGPQIPSSQWTSGYVQDTSSIANATHYGRVTSGTAYLTNGSICYSGYPTGSAYVS